MEALSSRFGLICIFCQKISKWTPSTFGANRSYWSPAIKAVKEGEQEQSEVQALQKSSGSTHVDYKLQQDQLEDMRIFDGNFMSLLEQSDS